jgi:hypothetical protein
LLSIRSAISLIACRSPPRFGHGNELARPGVISGFRKLGGMLEEQSTVAIDMIAELDGRAGIRLDQTPERCPPLS